MENNDENTSSVLPELVSVTQTWSGSVDDVELRRLCETALTALYEEERALQSAFASANAAFYAPDNHGLAYWLYETTLCYLIFKAWIPYTCVVWDWAEARPGKRRGRSAIDLTVHDPDDRSRIRFAFEAKYWMSEAQTPWVLKDAEKLAGASADRKFLIAFWRTDESQFGEYNQKVTDVATRKHWMRIFSGRFPCHVAGKPGWSFVLDVVELLSAK